MAPSLTRRADHLRRGTRADQAGAMAKMEHFEIPVDDIERAQVFYREVLGYDYEPWQATMGMLRQPDGEGTDGDLHLRGEASHPTVVFTVDRIEDTVAQAIELGGEQIGDIHPLGDDARWVYIRDSEGNLIGLFDKV
jgi:predicted enzyme related to lactoylglutathione lyase